MTVTYAIGVLAGVVVGLVIAHSVGLWRRQREVLAGNGRPAAPVVVLELEPVYPNGATGALFRSSLGELEQRATTDDPEIGTLYPATFELPCVGARGVRVRVARASAELAAIYAGQSLAVERESEAPPAFLTGGRS